METVKLHVDFETRSTIDLRKVGVYKYAAHPTTDIWCMAYAFDDEDVQLWTPGDLLPADVLDHIGQGHGIFAWNAQFERIMWRDVLTPLHGFPLPARRQFFCSAAEAAAMALPRSLDQAARVLNVKHKKDKAGHSLMLRMCRPRSTKGGEIVWWTEPGRLQRLYEYCMNDVRAERAVGKRLRPLSPKERTFYLLDQIINDRGVYLDLPLVDAAQRIVDEGLLRANTLLEELTGGQVDSVTKRDELLRWLQYQGLDIEDIRKATVARLSSMIADTPDTPHEQARQVLEIRAEAARTSNSKVAKMREVAGPDSRARGLLLYHGASTGRWSGKLIQPQNFPKGEVPDIESYIERVLAIDYDGIDKDHPPLVVVSSMLRSMLCAAPGNRLLSADYSQIEARVLNWIAEQDDMVRTFAAGGKVYERMAARIYGKPAEEILKPSRERDVGKAAELGCGYGMGWRKFMAQQAEQGIYLEEKESRDAVDAYRDTHGWVTGFWESINRAAMRAVCRPGEITYCGRGDAIRFVMRGQFLWCILPNGRPLAYALPVIEDRKTPWGEMRPCVTFMGINSYSRKWERRHSYGGFWTENVVQAMSRDLMAEAMLRVELAGYAVILTVHDEVVAEVPIELGSLDEFCQLMKRVPKWARGCPVAVEGWEGERYRK